MEVTRKGALEIQTPAQMDNNERAAIKAEEAKKAPDAIQYALESFTHRCFQTAKEHKDRFITPKLLESQRQYDGEYEASVLAQIQEMGGTEVFMNITQTKADALFSWLRDIVNPAGDRAFGLDITPIPSLPPEIENEVVQNVVNDLRERVIEQGMTPEDVASYAAEMYDQRIHDLVAEAKKRAKRHEDKIYDQFVEGEFFASMEDMIRDLCKFKTAWMKGPIVRKKKRLEYDSQDDGSLIPSPKEVDVPTYSAPSPFDMYPAPSASSVAKAPYICETIEISGSELSALRNVEGYQTAKIEMILSTMPNGYRIGKVESFEVQEAENRDPEKTIENTATYDAVEFWGSVPRHMLKDFGIAGEGDDYEYVSITSLSIAGHIIRAIQNPSPIGLYPYHATSAKKQNRSIWGKSIPEMIKEIQSAYASTHRALINNMALGAGPQVAVNTDCLQPGDNPRKITPMKVWLYSGKGDPVGSRQPVHFFHPEIKSQEIIAVAKNYEDMADDRTAIPRYAYGNADVGGAGKTAAGLSMLMSNAAKGVRVVAGNVDRDIISSMVSMQHTWNLVYLDESWNDIKGDAIVVPRGVLAILVKEQLQLRRQEFLNLTNNPTDLAIMGRKGRARLLTAIATNLDIDPTDLIPTDEELDRQARASLEQQMVPPGPEGGAPLPEGVAQEGVLQ